MSLRVQYARPLNVDQTVALLGELSSGAVIIAGGQELMPFINYGRVSPSVLVDISGLKDLQNIETSDDGLSIGALTVHRDIQINPLINEIAPLLAHAALQIGGGRQVHNQGTIGGNIVAMHPLYDIIPALLVLDAEIEITSQQGSRIVSMADLINESNHKMGTHAVLTRVLIGNSPAGQGWGYEKLKITDGCYGSANAAATVCLAEDGQVQSVRLAIGAVTEKILNLSEDLATFLPASPDADLDSRIAGIVESAVEQPLSDQQGHGEYRRAMAGVVARKAFHQALDMARQDMALRERM